MAVQMQTVEKILCPCCGKPVAELRDGIIIIRVRHFDEQHETRISVLSLDNKRAIVVT